MTGYKTFSRGGIHPLDMKFLTKDKAIRNAFIPSTAIIPMLQHMGKPAICTVNINDNIKEGMLIGKSSGFISSNIYSSIPGKVIDIRETLLPNNAKCQAVVIQLAGEFDRSGKEEKTHKWEHISSKQLLDKITDMGVVGLGGAAFPSHVKFTLKENESLDAFIVNGVECEPFLTCDHRLMVEKTSEILTGIKIIQKILKPSRIIIGIEENKPDAIKRFNKLIAEQSLDFKVVSLRVKYPQGDEKLMIKTLLGKEVPSGGLPLDAGAIVSNAATVFSIYEAIILNKPVTERIVTVTGSIVKNPSNLKVRTGTMISSLFDECGGFTEKPAKIIVGGPMMGFSVYDPDLPVTKSVSGVIALSAKQVSCNRQTNCISCGRCIRSCPIGLNPTGLYKWIDHNDFEQARENGLLDCRECGCCAYICPARLPLVHSMRLGKLMLRKKVESK